MNKTLLGLTSLILAAFLFGIQGILSRFIGPDFGYYYLVAVRSAFIAAFFLICLLIQRNWKGVDKSDYKWFGLMSIPGILALIAIFMAFNHLEIGTVLFISYSTIIIGGYFLGWLIFREKFTKIKIVSLILGLLGLSLIFSKSIKMVDLPFFLLALASGLGVAAWNVFSKKVSSKYPLTEILFIDALLSLIIGLLLFTSLKDTLTPFSLSPQWISVLGLISVTIIALMGTVVGFRYLQAQIGSIVMLLEVVFGIILAWFIFQESLTLFSFIGGTLIMIGAALPNLFPEKNN